MKLGSAKWYTIVMKTYIHKIGKFYTRIIMDNIGIFIFIGLMSIVFNDYGWLPNKDIYAISQLAYEAVLPVMIAYEGGKRTGGPSGGVLAGVALTGLLAANTEIGLWGALATGPLSGFLWKCSYEWLQKHIKASLQMLVKNLYIGILGALLAVTGYFFLAPVLGLMAKGLAVCVDYLVMHKFMAVLSVLTEPGKIFFLNNILNHAVFVPLGISQVQETGSSVLFLIESNPGPGLGMLAALLYRNRKRKGKRCSEYLAAMFAQSVGGVHEVYFPFALSNLWLLLPLIAGGSAGTLVFELLDAGLQGAVSPGSLVTILIMAGKGSVFHVALGIGVSALVSFACSTLVLRIQEHKNQRIQGEENGEGHMEKSREEKEHLSLVRNIGFVCDGGVGSSAMGAALLRRKLAAEGVEGIRVKPYAVDLVPKETDLLVCQKDFYERIPLEMRNREVYVVNNLMDSEAYSDLVRRISKG